VDSAAWDAAKASVLDEEVPEAVVSDGPPARGAWDAGVRASAAEASVGSDAGRPVAASAAAAREPVRREPAPLELPSSSA
jgi:hypothetical protein